MLNIGNISLGRSTKRYTHDMSCDNNTTMSFGFFQPLYTQMRQTIPETRDKAPESRLMPAFAVQELPPLTAQELAELAQAQQARNSIE